MLMPIVVVHRDKRYHNLCKNYCTSTLSCSQVFVRILMNVQPYPSITFVPRTTCSDAVDFWS
jgi:hypothetical protein